MSIFIHLCPPPAYLQVSGEDAQSYLQSQLTIDLVSMGSDEIRYGLRLDKKGKTQAGMYVIKTDEENFSLISRGTSGSELVKLLEENVVADEIEFDDRSSEHQLLTVYGPDAHLLFNHFKQPCPSANKVVRNPNFVAFLDPRLAPATFTLVIPEDQNTFANLQVTFTEEYEIEKARIQSTLVTVPDEIGPDELPQEGGLEKDCVDFQKGCYLGQEVMARIHAMGKVRRQTVTLSFESTIEPEIPCPLLNGSKKVGILKSFVKVESGYLGIAIIHENGMPALKDGKLKMNQNTSKITLYES